jgi:hypothetical protein
VVEGVGKEENAPIFDPENSFLATELKRNK